MSKQICRRKDWIEQCAIQPVEKAFSDSSVPIHEGVNQFELLIKVEWLSRTLGTEQSFQSVRDRMEVRAATRTDPYSTLSPPVLILDRLYQSAEFFCYRNRRRLPAYRLLECVGPGIQHPTDTLYPIQLGGVMALTFYFLYYIVYY